MTDCGCRREHCSHNFCVRKVPVFASLKGVDLASVATMIRHLEYRKGELLFSEGDALDALVILMTIPKGALLKRIDLVEGKRIFAERGYEVVGGN